MRNDNNIAERMLGILNSKQFQKTFDFSKTGSKSFENKPSTPLTKTASTKVEKTAFEYCLDSLAKLSEIFDQKGLAKSSAMTILTMNTLIKEAQDGYLDQQQQPSKMPIDDSGALPEKENCMDCNFTAEKPLHGGTYEMDELSDFDVLKDAIADLVIEVKSGDTNDADFTDPEQAGLTGEEPPWMVRDVLEHGQKPNRPMFTPWRYQNLPDETKGLVKDVLEKLDWASDPEIQSALKEFHEHKNAEKAIAEVRAILADKYKHLIKENIDETPDSHEETDLPEEIVVSLRQLNQLISLGKKEEKEEKICKKCDKKMSKCKCKEIAEKEKEKAEKEKAKEKDLKEKEKEKAKKEKEKKAAPITVLEFIQKQAELNKIAGGTLCGHENSKVKGNGDHYPIPDAAHGRNALGRVHQDAARNPSWWSGTEAELISTVERNVHGKFPAIGKDKKKKD